MDAAQKFALATAEKLEERELRMLATDDDPTIRLKIAERLDTPPDVLEWLARSRLARRKWAWGRCGC